MTPVTLVTERLTLDQPVIGDRELMVEYCRDPLFETFMLTPWPYEPAHAESFISEMVPTGWSSDTEYTWAIRRAPGTELLGVLGYREATRDIGYWLGAPHRGQGIMSEAASAVIDWLFAQGKRTIAWECLEGNLASLSVARRLGFRYSGTGPSALGERTGSSTPSWHARLNADDDRSPQPGWPV